MQLSFIKKILLFLHCTGIFISGISNSGNAQKTEGIKEILQEFFIGETVYAQEKNEIQFTSKPSYWKQDGLETTGIPLQFEYGFTDRLQIELNLPYYFRHPKIGRAVNGAGNVEAGFLYNILRGNKLFALSVGLDMGLPTAKKEKDVDEAAVEWEPSLIVARHIGRAQIHASFGAELTKNESGLSYNLGTVFPFGAWRATLELNGKINDSKEVYLTPGLIWKGLDHFEFGFGFSKGVTKAMGWGSILMATYEFSLTKENK